MSVIAETQTRAVERVSDGQFRCMRCGHTFVASATLVKQVTDHLMEHAADDEREAQGGTHV